MKQTKERPADFDKWWPCCCVKRDKAKKLTHIKMNAPALKKCSTCGAKNSEQALRGV